MKHSISLRAQKKHFPLKLRKGEIKGETAVQFFQVVANISKRSLSPRSLAVLSP